MAAAAGLDAGLLVGAEDVVLGPQGLALPQAGIQVQNRAGLVGKSRVPGKYPVLVAPRFDGIRREQPPHRAATDRCAQRVAAPRSDIGQGLSAQRLLGVCNQFTGDCLDQRVIQRGKNLPCGPVPACRPGQSLLGPSGDATAALNTDGAVPVVPPRCWTPTVVAPRAAPGRPVVADGTEWFFAGQSVQLLPRTSMGTQDGGSVGDHAWETSFG
jgi:hypothetical protein